MHSIHYLLLIPILCALCISGPCTLCYALLTPALCAPLTPAICVLCSPGPCTLYVMHFRLLLSALCTLVHRVLCNMHFWPLHSVNYTLLTTALFELRTPGHCALCVMHSSHLYPVFCVLSTPDSCALCNIQPWFRLLLFLPCTICCLKPKPGKKIACVGGIIHSVFFYQSAG